MRERERVGGRVGGGRGDLGIPASFIFHALQKKLNYAGESWPGQLCSCSLEAVFAPWQGNVGNGGGALLVTWRIFSCPSAKALLILIFHFTRAESCHGHQCGGKNLDHQIECFKTSLANLPGFSMLDN